MSISRFLQQLLNDVLKNVHPINRRRWVQKLLKKLPQSVFPNYRMVINSVIIESNRRTLNFLKENSFSSLSSSSSSSGDIVQHEQKSKKKHPKKMCKHCQKLYYPRNQSKATTASDITPQTISLRPENHTLWKTVPFKQSNSQPRKNKTFAFDYAQISCSTPIKSWLEEVEDALIEQNASFSPPSSPPKLKTDREEFLSETPLRRITASDIQAVKLKPISLQVPKTLEVHDMMAVLRKRFAVMHSPLFDDSATVRSDSGDECSGSYSDFSDASWSARTIICPIGVM